MEKEIDCFETISVLNRLDMAINIDVAVACFEDKLIVIVKANSEYHRSTVAKNIEQIAFQLKQRFANYGRSISVVEYAHAQHKNIKHEWWQWRLQWVGNTPLDAQRHALSPSKVRAIKNAMMRFSEAC